MKSRTLDLDYRELFNDNCINWKEFSCRKVLITGATGLVGSLICRAFLQANSKYNLNLKVFIIVRNIEKTKFIFEDLLDYEVLVPIEGDITKKIQFDESIDYVFHCASITSSKIMISNPIETILTSIDGTKNILEIARANSLKAFVYVSSMEMYGTFEDNLHDISENDLGYIDPLAIRSNYPESKRMCENLCVAYYKEYNVPIRIARLAQTFGAGILSGENRVFAQFARSIIKNENIVLHTKGLSEGNYCYSTDMVKGVIMIATKGGDCEAYNVSNPQAHSTIADMAEMLCREFTNNNLKVIYDIPETNLYGYASDTKMKLDSSKLQALGWKPTIDLKEAYRRLIEYIDEQEGSDE